MDALDAIRGCLTEQTVTCDIYHPSGDGPYEGDLVDTGETVDVAIVSPTSQSQLVVEGSGQETSLVGHVVPEYSNNRLQERVFVNDQLRPHNTGKRYDVRTKDGVPSPLEPELWQLGLERANASQTGRDE
jgi:hypothetical protein